MSDVNTTTTLPGLNSPLHESAEMSIASMAEASGRPEEEIRSLWAAMGSPTVDFRAEAFLRGDSVPMTVTEARDMPLIAAEEVHRKCRAIETNIANSPPISEEAWREREMNHRFEDPDGTRDWAANPVTLDELKAREQRRQ